MRWVLHQPAVWRELSHRLDGRFLYDTEGRPVVQWSRHHWRLTLDLAQPDAELPLLRFRAPYPADQGLQFSISRKEGWVHAVRSFFDRDDEDGLLPEERFEVQCEQPDRLRALLARRNLAGRITETPPLLLAAREDEGSGPRRYPRGVDVLVMEVQARELLTPLERFARLFADAAWSMDELSAGGEEGTEEDRLLRQLHGPAGRVVDRGVELWDGDALRSQAAQALAAEGCERALPGILRLLEESRAGTRMAAARALRKLRDPAAIPGLIPLLADERTAGSAKVCEEAAVTLRKLGAGNWVDWFGRVMGGTMPASRLDGPYREAAAEALVQISRQEDQVRAIRACHALGELGAPETFSAVQQVISRYGRHRVGSAFESLLKELESVAGLPRPAAAPAPERETLPLASSPPASDEESTLPRASSPGDSDLA